MKNHVALFRNVVEGCESFDINETTEELNKSCASNGTN